MSPIRSTFSSTHVAIERTMHRSMRIPAATPGRCTLRATVRLGKGACLPSRSNCSFMRVNALSRRVALYTCPKLAAATGSSLTLSKTSSIEHPSSSWTMDMASWVGNRGVSSCNFPSSSMYAGGTRSGRLLSACPTLTNAGPRRTRACRSLEARSLADDEASSEALGDVDLT